MATEAYLATDATLVNRIPFVFVAVYAVGWVIIALAGDGGDDPRPPAKQAAWPLAADAQGREYVGSKRCKMCHTKWYESWSETHKADAIELLRPGAGIAVKKRAGLDLKTDYTTDGQCLRCHTVGYGEPGGYEVPPANDGKAQRRARAREGVGCESCHGPGSDYTKVMSDILLKERPYRAGEVLRAGRRTVDESVCLACHNETAICMSGGTNGNEPYRFRVDMNNPLGFHQHFPLRFRVSE